MFFFFFFFQNKSLEQEKLNSIQTQFKTHNILESCHHSSHSWGRPMHCYWVRWPTLIGH